MSGDSREMLYPRESLFFTRTKNRFLAAFRRGTYRAVSMACVHRKRLPLAWKYCM